jgi:DNA-binding transcriptional regulator YdaS (Cro superfamily)
MELRKYLESKKINMTEFGGLIGCNQSYISLLCQKKRRPSPGLALEIEKATGGKVTVMELLYPDEKAA